MPVTAIRAKIQNRKLPHRPPLELNRLYPRSEAALVIGCATITLIRAYEAEHLKGYRVGRYIKHSGQHLIDWLEAGGKTGHSAKKGGAR